MTSFLPIFLRTGLFIIFAFAALTSIARADPPNPGRATAKIISIDFDDNSIILEIKSTRYRFVLNPHLINRRTQKPFALNRLVPGQVISFISQPETTGQLEITAVAVMPPDAPTGATGGGTAPDGGPQTLPPLVESPEATPFE